MHNTSSASPRSAQLPNSAAPAKIISTVGARVRETQCLGGVTTNRAPPATQSSSAFEPPSPDVSSALPRSAADSTLGPHTNHPRSPSMDGVRRAGLGLVLPSPDPTNPKNFTRLSATWVRAPQIDAASRTVVAGGAQSARAAVRRVPPQAAAWEAERSACKTAMDDLAAAHTEAHGGRVFTLREGEVGHWQAHFLFFVSFPETPKVALAVPLPRCPLISHVRQTNAKDDMQALDVLFARWAYALLTASPLLLTYLMRRAPRRQALFSALLADVTRHPGAAANALGTLVAPEATRALEGLSTVDGVIRVRARSTRSSRPTPVARPLAGPPARRALPLARRRSGGRTGDVGGGGRMHLVL
ncbi:hypothetical protein FB451DRAFT_1461134 [Mycena latifolia]|nr:hypothetical protein FB451DRAFT_1461134 [Mycena latifolia]